MSFNIQAKAVSFFFTSFIHNRFLCKTEAYLLLPSPARTAVGRRVFLKATEMAPAQTQPHMEWDEGSLEEKPHKSASLG